MENKKENSETNTETNRDSHQKVSELRDVSNRLADDAEELMHVVRKDNPVLEYYEENPFKALAAASGVGYLLGGGLFTPFTKRVLKIGMKGLLLPIAAKQFEELTSQPENFEESQPRLDEFKQGEDE